MSGSSTPGTQWQTFGQPDTCLAALQDTRAADRGWCCRARASHHDTFACLALGVASEACH